MTEVTRHKSLDELEQKLDKIAQAPRGNGSLEAIVIRPSTNERVSLTTCALSPERGVHGDNWEKGYALKLPDGSPNPDVQVTLTSARVLASIAETREQWPLAGDNLVVDLDLSEGNLPTGQRLKIGSVLLEVTAEPHNGCQKFADRFGSDALKFVNSELGKRMHLRGIYAKVVTAGVVEVGDQVQKC